MAHHPHLVVFHFIGQCCHIGSKFIRNVGMWAMIKATTWCEILFLEPQAVALNIFLPGHLNSWNLYIKWMVLGNIYV